MTTKQIESGQLPTLVIGVREPSQEARETVAAVVSQCLRELDDMRYERMVFETPGVLEGFDVALEELEALKRSM